MNKTQISQMPDEELISTLRDSETLKSGSVPFITIAFELADRLEIRNGDLESKRAHEQTMAEVDELRLEMANAWEEWLELPDMFPTPRLLDAMEALIPRGSRPIGGENDEM